MKFIQHVPTSTSDLDKMRTTQFCVCFLVSRILSILETAHLSSIKEMLSLKRLSNTYQKDISQKVISPSKKVVAFYGAFDNFVLLRRLLCYCTYFAG